MKTFNVTNRPTPISMPVSDNDRITSVAREFESLFTSMMFKAMRKTIGDNSLIPCSIGEKIYTEMLDTTYADLSGKGTSLGLANLIEKEIRDNCTTAIPTTENSVPLWIFDKQFHFSEFQPSNQKRIDYKQLANRIEKWDSLISTTSEKYTVDKDLVAAVIAQESGGNPYAVSRAGAKGLMQLMDGTAAQMGITSSFNPEQNIDAGVRYLKSLLITFKGNEELALASYNAGPGAVEKYGGIPPYRETQMYVKSVLSIRNTFTLAANKSTALE